MKKSTIFVSLTAIIFSSVAFAGTGVKERAMKRMKMKAQYNTSMGLTQSQNNTAVPKRGPVSLKKYTSAAGVLAQVDDAANNQQIWGIYGPGTNIIRDFDTGRIDIGWSNTYATNPPQGKQRVMAYANSVDDGATWTLTRGISSLTEADRAYYGVVNHAYSAAAGVKTLIMSYVSREDVRVDFLEDLIPGFGFFNRRTLFDISAGVSNDLVFTFMASGDSAAVSSNIYVTEYQTSGPDAFQTDNIIFVKSTDGGASWTSPTYIFGDGIGQIPFDYSLGNGNYCALAMAVDPNEFNHIGGLFITNYIPNEGFFSDDSLFHSYGLGIDDYHYYFTESFDAGNSWSTPELLLGRDPADRLNFEYSFTMDTTGNGQPDIVTNGYPYGGAFFWAFLYEPIFTTDGTFHAAIMPTIVEFPNPQGETVFAPGGSTNRNAVIYARRDAAGNWSYNHDWGAGSTTFAFDSSGNELDARIGQAWFAQVHKAHDDDNVIAISYSSRLGAYNTIPNPSGDPRSGAWVYAYSPDGGVSWSNSKAYFPAAGMPVGADSVGSIGGWFNSSAALELWTDPDTLNKYHFDLIWGVDGIDNITVHPDNPGIWYSSEPSFVASIPVGPQISVSPTSLNFDSVSVGGSLVQTLRINSSGTDTLEVMNIASNNSDFGVSETSFLIAPSSSHEVSVTFSPSSVGAINGALTITSNSIVNSVVLVALSGIGETADLGVSIFITFGNPGDTVVVPIIVTGVEGFDINSAEFSVVSDSLLTPVSVSSIGGVLAGMNWLIEHSLSGDTVRVAAAGSDTLNSSGTLVNILYVIDSTAVKGMVGNIRFDSFLFNEGLPVPALHSGRIDIGVPYGDVSRDGGVHAFDAALIMMHLIGQVTFDLNQKIIAEVSGDGNITTFDASLILQKVVKLIDLFPVEGGALLVINPSSGFELPDLSAAPGELLSYPVYLEDVSDLMSFEATLDYDPELLNLEGFEFSDYFGNWLKGTREEEGRVKLYLASARPAEGNVLLGNALFRVIEGTEGDVKIYLRDVRLNEEEIISDAASGTISLTVTGVLGESDGIPLSFEMSQNYPNPFNPLTEIRYALPSSGRVMLTVYNILGQEVASLVDGEMPAGYHRVRWDAGEMSSGVYIYRIQFRRSGSTDDNFIDSKKLVLMK